MDILSSTNDPDQCSSSLSYQGSSVLIIISCVVGILWSLYNFFAVRRVDLQQSGQNQQEPLADDLPAGQKQILLEMSYKISDSTVQFIKQQYMLCVPAVVIVFVGVWQLSEQGITTAVAFLVGALTSLICETIGLVVSTQSNFRVAYCCRFGLAPAFRTAYKAAVSIGFGLTSFCLLVLIVLIDVLKDSYQLKNQSADRDYYKPISEAVIGFGLGSSFAGLFGRIGGGVFKCASETGGQLIGRLEQALKQASANNPATIVSMTGENINQVGAVGSDLFGSLSQSICAAILLSANTLIGSQGSSGQCDSYLSNLLYPLVLMSLGLLVCLIVSAVATNVQWVQQAGQLGRTMKMQMLLSALVMIGVIYLSAYLSFPGQFQMLNLYGKYHEIQQNWVPYFCSLLGLLCITLIAIFTELLTSQSFFPAQALAQSCRSGSASNVTLGLSLGYLSTILPVALIALVAYYTDMFLGFYGIALAAIGALCNMPILLALDSMSPITSNANQMVRLAQLGQQSQQMSQALDQSCKIVAASGQSITITIAAFAALSLFGGFLYNTQLDLLIVSQKISMTEPLVFTGLLLGSMIPFIFVGLIIRSIKNAAIWLADEVRRQTTEDQSILQGNSQADFANCAAVTAKASFLQLALPSLLMIAFPLILGFAIGPKILAGFLMGSIISGVQLAISGSNSGCAWSSAKRVIESGGLTDGEGRVLVKGSQAHKASLVGDVIGDSLQDGAAFSINILIKLMAMISLILGPRYLKLHPN